MVELKERHPGIAPFKRPAISGTIEALLKPRQSLTPRYKAIIHSVLSGGVEKTPTSTESSQQHNRQSPGEWAAWILDEENRFEEKAKVTGRPFFKRSPGDIVAWTASLSGATENLAALINEIDDRVAQGRLVPEERIAPDRRLGLITQSWGIHDQDPYAIRKPEPLEYYVSLLRNPAVNTAHEETVALLQTPEQEVAPIPIWKKALERAREYSFQLSPRKMAQGLRLASFIF